MNKIFLSVLFISLLIPALVYPHSGRTDAYGGHNNRKTGGYHYHNAGTLHAKDNPFQDHSTCGICTPAPETSSKTHTPGNLKQNHDLCGICHQLNSYRAIAKTQELLKTLNMYTGRITGQIDNQTIESVKAAQKRYGIKQTGHITQYLLIKLVLES